MRLDHATCEVREPPRTGAVTDAPRDLRFCALLTDGEWAALPEPVRRRFSRGPGRNRTIIYCGRIMRASMTRAGWLVAQAARLIGAPLPTSRDTDVPSVVTVTEDGTSGGQMWTVLYGRRRGFPQIIHSAKRFSGPTGLEEYLGYGVTIALTMRVRAGALLFRSDHYSVTALGRRIVLPRWISPDVLTVTHTELGGGRFLFALELVHPLAGVLIHQTVEFEEVTQ
jgi:hypothetical protein